MDVCHLNFARPTRSSSPSSLSLASYRKTRNSAREANVGGLSFTTRSPLKWSKKSPRQIRCLSHLLTKQNHDSGSPSCRREGFSQQHLNVRNRFTLSKAARKLGKSPGHAKSLKKRNGRLLDKNQGAYGEGKGKHHGTIMASKDDDGGERESMEGDVQRGRVWWPYAAGGVSLSSVAVAAHASVGYGGGNGPQPPFRSGGGGGGGGGDNGGFEAGGNGESFFGDLIYGPQEEREEESSLPRAAVRVRGRMPDNRLSGRSLASLSSAAGDLMDGEAPIGGGVRERGESGRMSRGLEETHHHIPNKHASYDAPFPDEMREHPRDSTTRSYNTADPFFSGGDLSRQDLHSNSPSSAFEGVGIDDNMKDMNRGRDASFTPMAGGRSSTGYNSNSNHFPSAKQQQQQQQTHFPSAKQQQQQQQQQQYHHQHHKNYAQQGSEFKKAPGRGSDSYYSHGATTSRGDPLQIPSEFSSIRGKIREIPGYVEEGGGVGGKSNRHRQAFDFSGWLGGLGGLVSSIVGKGTGGRAGLGTEGRSGDAVRVKELIAEVANRTLQMIKDPTTENGLAKSSETGSLRRLQRETFSDLMKIRERLEKLEHHTGASRGKHSGDSLTGARTSLKGEVKAGGAYVLLDDLTTNLSRLALQHAGLMTGLDVRFTFETPMRENDLLTTQCGVGQASGELDSNILGGPISLQKINYVAQINDAFSVAVAPLGAKANDMAETVNHLQGQALTTFAGSGPTMYQHCRGSAIGASLRSNSVMLSMSQFLSGWGYRALDTMTSGPLCLSTLAQIMVQPCQHMVFSMSAVNNLWPCPPLPSSNDFHWSEMGPMLLCKTITRPTQPTGTFTFNDLLPTSSTASFLSQVHVPERDRWSPDVESTLGSNGTSMQSVAFSGEVDLGGHVSIGGWAQLERADWLEELERKDFQWNVSLAKSSGPNVHWGLSMGRRKRDEWGEDGSVSPTSGPLDPSSQLQMEAFVKLKVGQGFSLQPGLVYIVDKDIQTPAFMLKSSWSL